MATHAVIIIPSQGDDIGSFYSVATKVKRDVFGGSAKILKTVVDASLSVTYEPPFILGPGFGFKAVITISHAGIADGPNLAYGAGGYQPWGLVDYASMTMTERGRQHWSQVGQSLKSSGKIILLGCYLGQEWGGARYGQTVANVSGRKTYAARDALAAGDSSVAPGYVQSIMNGSTPSAMRRFSPGG